MKIDDKQPTKSLETGVLSPPETEVRAAPRSCGAASVCVVRQADEQAAENRRHQQLMEAVGELAASVAHDFNNILTVIHGHASMLLLKLGPEGVHAKSVNEIRNSAERATNLVRQLLMFGHKQILQFRDVDLNEVIRSVSSSLRQLAGEHIIVETDCDSGLPPIHADRGMVEQVIVNLTQNAREAMPGGGRLVIQSGVAMVKEPGAGVGREGRPGEFVRLTVSAIGGGVDAAAAARPFEPNFSNTDASKRTVLGLATAYGIIKQHRGWIDVQAPGTQGANFQVYFPVSEPASPRSSEVGAQPPERLTKSALISPA